MELYDVIVLGTGGVGSAALYHAAAQGFSTLGIDRFAPGHDRGSSHGQTRIIRQAYFEHPDYVPLVRRAYRLWNALQRQAGEQLFFPTGLLEVGPPTGIVVPGVLASAAQHVLKVEQLSHDEIARRFPQFSVPPGYAGVFEASAGCLRVERCVVAYIAEAQKRGAESRVGEAVQSWRVEGGNAIVETDRATYKGRHLIITAGPWAADLLQGLGLKLRVLKKHMYWYAGASAALAAENSCPAYLFELPHGVFYGFPQFEAAAGVKVAEHSGGEEVADPLSATRDRSALDEARVEAFVRAYLPGVIGAISDHATCFYTMSADEHFIVDRHPQFERVSFACGLSGHGFKFASVLGEALVNLALTGKTELPIGFLGLSRRGLRLE